MKLKIKNFLKFFLRYIALIITGILLLAFLIKGYNTADDVTFNQGQVVITASQLMNDLFAAHLNLQEIKDHKEKSYATKFKKNIKDALNRVDILQNGRVIDGKHLKPLQNKKIRANLEFIKKYINQVKNLDETVIANNFEFLNGKQLYDFHKNFDVVIDKIYDVKTKINQHFDLNRKNFHKYKILSIVFTSVLLFTLAFVLILNDKRKLRDIQLLNNANQALKEKIEQQIITREKLQNEIQRNRLILNTTLNGFILADTYGQILDVNPAYCEMTGYSKEELLKMNIKQLEAKIPADKIDNKIDEIIAKSKDRFETQHKAKEGNIIDFDVSISIMNLDNKTLLAAFLNDITEYKKTAEKLRTDEERYRIILNNIEEIVYQVKFENNNLFEGNIVFVSPKTEIILGIEQNKLYNNPSLWINSIHPEDVESVKNSTLKILNSGKSGIRDYRIKNKITGEYRWVEDRITPLLNKAGKLTGMVGVARDVTEWVNAKEELEKKELRYRTLFDFAPSGIMLEDKNGNIIDANPATCSTFGYQKDELLGKNVSIFTHPENKGKITYNINKVLKGETLKHTLKSIKKDGSEIYIRLSETKIQLPNLEDGLLCVSEDITDNIKMQEMLKKSEEKYKKLIEISPVGITIIQKGKIIFANSALSRTLGFSNSGELIGKSILEFIHPDYREFAKERLMFLQTQKNKRVNLAEEKFIKKNGDIIDVLVVGQQLDYEGESAVQGYIYDISEQKMLTDALQKSQERLQEAQHIAHLGNWDWNIGTNELFWSDEVYNIFGLLPQEFIVTYDAFFEFIHPEDRNKVKEAVDAAINKNKPYNIVHRIQLKNGKIKFVQEIGKVYFNSENEPVRMIGTVQDITELKKTEQALIESESRISGIMKAAPVGIGVIKNRILGYVNNFLCNMIGYTKEEIIGKSSRDFYESEKEYEKIGKLYEKALKEGVASGEAKIKHKSGIILDVIISLCPLDKNDLSKGSIFSVLDITTRKQIETHLKIEEARYRVLFEHSPISIWEEDFSEGKKFIDNLKENGVTDLDKYFTDNNDQLLNLIGSIKIVDINTETIKMLKAESKEIILEGLSRIFIPESVETFKKEIVALANGKTKFASESKQKNFMNELRNIFVTVAIAPGYEDTWGKVFVTVSDITEQKKSEEAIKNSEANLRSLIEGRQESIWSIDKNYNFLTINNLFKKYFKHVYGIEITKGMNSLDVLKKELRDIWETKYQQVFSGKKINFQFNETIDNKTHYFDVYINPIIKDKTVSGASVIAIDVTDKVEAAEKLKYQAKLLDSAQDAIIASNDQIIDNELNNIITYWNKGAERLYGWQENEVLGKGIRDILKSRPIGTTFEIISKELSDKGEWVGEIIQQNRKGEKLIALTSINAVYEDGKMVGTFGVNRDITELKEAYNKLEESQKQLRALTEYLEKVREEERTYIAREIHDDLGQTLTALKIDLSWLNKNFDPGKKSSRTKIQNMIKLIDSTIKTVQKISSQLRPGILDDLGLVAAIEWATKEFERRTGINCKVKLKPVNFEIKENISVALFRIYQEILTNISRHANADNVNIKIFKSDKEILLDVTDNGIGIDENKIDNPKSLGLLGIKERTRGLGGAMEIKGIHGKGTQIKIILPLND